MIIIGNAPQYALYYRTNRRVNWRYATYAGCYETIEAAIESLKKHMPGQEVQYMIEDTKTGKIIIGDISVQYLMGGTAPARSR